LRSLLAAKERSAMSAIEYSGPANQAVSERPLLSHAVQALTCCRSLDRVLDLLGDRVAAEVPGLVIIGPDLPIWNITHSSATYLPRLVARQELALYSRR